MALMSMLRTQLRYTRGQRPRVEDLERIVHYMRRRRARGLDPVPWRVFGTLRGWGRPSPERTVAQQARLLRQTVAYVYRYVPFYREAMDAAGLRPTDIRSQTDVHKLPITRRQQLEADTEAFVSCHPDVVSTTVSRSSGTTGKIVSTYVSIDEIRYYAATRAIAWLMGGRLDPTDIVQVNTGSGSFSTFLNSMSARMVGALVLTPGLQGSLDDHLESIFKERRLPGKKPQVSVLYIYPTHLWALSRRAQEKGLDFGDSGLEQIATGSATVSDDLRQLVRDTWGIELREGYGLNELAPIVTPQCRESQRLHFPDVLAYAETLDPESREPVARGQPGVLTITSLYPYREAMPLLRYWTDDLVILSPDPVCVCGAATTQILEVVGRVDHMVIVGSANIYPHKVGDSLREFPELAMPPRFILRTEQRDDAQYAILDVEVAETLSSQEARQLRQRIEQGSLFGRFSEVTLGSVKVVVNLHPAGTIQEPFPYKLHEGGGRSQWVEQARQRT